MELLKVIVLGIIQGIAEFLPISSSGHLALFQQGFHMNLEGGMLLDIMLHFGTLIAIFVAFWRDMKKLILEGLGLVGDLYANVRIFVQNRAAGDEKNSYRKVVNSAYRKFVVMVIISTIPTGIIGYLVKDLAERAMNSILLPGIGLLITAILLFLADSSAPGKKRPNQISYLESGLVGTAQGIAVFPGISRSGTTITACLLCGFDKNFAVKYSFIMSVPAVLGSMVLELKGFTSESVAMDTMFYYIIGTMIAAVVGYICIKTMLQVVRGKKYKYFAYYCMVIGIVAIVWSFV